MKRDRRDSKATTTRTNSASFVTFKNRLLISLFLNSYQKGKGKILQLRVDNSFRRNTSSQLFDGEVNSLFFGIRFQRKARYCLVDPTGLENRIGSAIVRFG